MSDTVPPSTDQSKPNPETTFIYALLDPNTQEVRYIGKANDPQFRLKTHLRKREATTHKECWIKHLKSLGLEPVLLVIEEVPLYQWEEREQYWIQHYRSQGAPLTNGTKGGDGMRSPTPELREKLSNSHKGKTLPQSQREKLSRANRGKKISDEHKDKIRNALSGRKRPPEVGAKESATKKAQGKTLSLEERQQLSLKLKGKKKPPRTEEHQRKIDAANRGRKHSPEARANMSLAQKKIRSSGKRKVNPHRKGAPPSEETRQKISSSLKGRKLSPEVRKNMSLGQKKRAAKKNLLSSDIPTLWDNLD